MELINVFVLAFLTENVILSRFLGMCSFLGTSNKKENAIGMGLCTTFVVLISTILTYVIDKYILIPNNATYLETIMFILVIASFVQITDIIVKKYFKKLHKSLGIYLPLITTNCAVFGIILTNIRMDYNLITSLVYSLGASLGYMVILYIFSTLREKINNNNVPSSFKGVPIALVTAGIMALIFGRII